MEGENKKHFKIKNSLLINKKKKKKKGITL